MAQLVVALDFDDSLEALNMATVLEGKVEWVKIGLELFITEGPRILQVLKGMKYKIFLDLKLHDIPNTIRGSVLASVRNKVDMLTMHVTGGEDMAAAAVDAIKDLENKPILLGVTVLTSLSDGELPGYSGSVTQLAQRLADEAYGFGYDGVVCSGHEVANIKKRHSKLLALCPGIRMASDDVNDQSRIVTPYDAVMNGADFLVVGRPITKAADPVQAVEDILANMKEAELVLE